MVNTNSNSEVIIKLIGRLSLKFREFEDFQKQLELKQTIEEVLVEYDITPKDKSLTISDMEEKIQMFLACRKLDGIAPKTLKNYNYVLLELFDFIKKPIISITHNDIRLFLIQKCANIKESSKATKIFILKAFFRWLFNEEYIVKNPMNKINPPKVPKRLKKPLNEEQLEKLRLACNSNREKALIEFAFSSACRVSEIASINVNDIDWQDMSVKIIGKGNKERKVYFSVKAKVLLESYLKNRKGSSEALFIGERSPYGRLGIRAIERTIEKVKNRAGFTDLQITPHSLRRTRATHSINKGVKLEVVQKLLGHESPNTTLIYAQLDDTYVKSEFNRIS